MANINDNICFKIFDKTFTNSTHVYGLHRYEDKGKLQKIYNNYTAICNELNANNLLILKHVHENKVVDADLLTNLHMK